MEVKNLLGLGLFPEGLPSSFSSKSLGENYDHIKAIRVAEKDSACSTFTGPRVKNFRRVFGIPNPMHQIKLAEGICTNWGSLQEFFDRSSFTTTKPVEDATGKRAIEREYKFPDFKDKCELCSYGFKYKLKLDIASFYSSIYTHTIGWAIHGREQGRDGSLYGNKLDALVRNTNKKQSIGIPIGPDTSLLISEIIGTGLDIFIKEKFPKAVGFRYVDDFNLYFETKSDAEKCLEAVENFLNGYHLACNDYKTYIAETVDPTDAPWVVTLSSFEISNNEHRQRDSIKRYFSLIFDFLGSHQAFNAAKFGAKKILHSLKNGEIHAANYDILSSLLFRLCLHAPDCLSYVFQFIDAQPELFELDMIKGLTINLLRECASTNRSYEIIWCLWIMARLEITIDSPELITELSKRQGIEIIQLADMAQRGFLSSTPEFYVEQYNSMAEENWMVIYMLERQGWIRNPKFTTSHTFFSTLADLNINFFQLENENPYENEPTNDPDSYPF